MAHDVNGTRFDQEKLRIQAHLEQRQHSDSPSQKTAMPRWRPKGKEKSSIALACMWIVEHQIGISLTILSLLFASHVFFAPGRHHTQKFFRISYFNQATGRFALGWDDIFFVFYWIVVFTGLRCIVMEYVLAPFAQACGIAKKKAKVRFAEQAWILLYYSMFWSTGMYIMYNSDYWLNLRALWTNWPDREMDGLSKWYYLVQFAFWLQQIVVVNIEERRKDHAQMFSHHIVTCILIFMSYGYHYSKAGTLILCLMDIADILLPAAKLLKYLRFQTACDIMFGVFMVTWFVTRHILYLSVLYSIHYHVPEEIRYGCFRGSTQHLEGPLPVPDGFEKWTMPFRDPEGLICFTDSVRVGFASMLAVLQCILCMWFVLIVRMAYKVVAGQGADDSRSDDEDDEEDEVYVAEEKKELIASVHPSAEPKPLVEKDVLSADYGPHSGSRRSTRRKEGGQSSGINVLGSADRKELLGRIGCDKPAS